MVHSFFTDGSFEPGMNDTNIILIPKITAEVKLDDYRPISLYNVRYKIISKMLVNRLQPMLGKTISKVQGTFILGKWPSDNIIIARELLHHMSAPWKKKYLVLKLDIRKAYDSLSWSFIRQCLTSHGFLDQVTSRIMHCMSSISYWVMVNR